MAKTYDFVVIYPDQKKTDAALRRTAEILGKESLKRKDVVRRKLTLNSGHTIRFLSENRLCDKLHTLKFDQPVGLIDCWSFDAKLDEQEKRKQKLKERETK